MSAIVQVMLALVWMYVSHWLIRRVVQNTRIYERERAVRIVLRRLLPDDAANAHAIALEIGGKDATTIERMEGTAEC